MKKFITSVACVSLLILTGCAESQMPMTEKEMAEKYGLTLEEYKENKEAAARMNMTIEEHLNMGH